MKKPHYLFKLFLQRPCLSLFLCFFYSYGSSQTFNIKNFNIEEGLPQSYVMAMLQDSMGYIWFGTADGLAKYDGTQFTTYTQKDGLAENYITAMAQDNAGNIWIGHELGGLSNYSFKEDTFIIKKNNLIPEARITQIFRDSRNVLWITTRQGAFQIKNDSLTKIFSPGAEEIDVLAITEDKKGRIWLGTIRNGIYILDNGQLEPLSGSPENVRSLLTDSRGNIWIGTAARGVWRLSQSGDLFSDKNIKKFPVENNLPVFALSEDSKGNIWYGTYGGGAVKITPELNEKKYTVKNGLSSDRIWAFLEDREGNIWAGTVGGGASQIKYNAELFQLYTEKDGLVNNRIWAITQDDAGNMWFGTEMGISKGKVGAGGGLTDLKIYSTEDGLAQNHINEIKEIGNSMWIGTREGLCLLNPSNGAVNCFTHRDGLRTSVIYSIAPADQNYVWLGNDRGSSKVKLQGKSLQIDTASGRIVNAAVQCMLKSTDGSIWFGTAGSGLIRYDGINITTFDEESGLPHEIIYSITEDKNKHIWFATEGGGIYRYNGSSFKNYTTANGLSSDNVYSIIADEKNNIWAGTSKGVDKLDPKTNRIKHYGKQEGFLGVEVNQDAVFKDGDGNLWFGTINGAVRYDPSAFVENTRAPETHITGLQVFYKNTPFPEDHQFSHKNNHLTFDFVGISHSNPEQVRYQWKLEGFDEDWSPITDQSYVTYANLSHGDYSFKVKAKNENGIWNEAPVTYNFTIVPPFHKTVLFYIICSILLIALVYLFIRYRTKKILKEKRMLEQRVRERTHELREEKEKVEQVNKEVIEQKAIIEEKNKDITDSIKYAKRIQEAILPDKQEIFSSLPEAFILYLPKDIVSGDFYWFEKKDGKIFIAAADCTGHGVPGALMSMIGNAFLNELVAERNITRPAEILNQLHVEIRTALKQREQNAEARDGMDIALCTIDIKRQVLEFAGAFRPLYLVRDEEIIEVNGDRQPIGGLQFEEERKFTHHEINYKTGDRLYLFSDGYADQFGGKKGKKFLAKRFKMLILDNHKMGMIKQFHIFEQNFREWKNGFEQIDDVLLIGIKL